MNNVNANTRNTVSAVVRTDVQQEKKQKMKVRCWFVTPKGMSCFTRHHLPPDSENLLSAVKRLKQGQLYSQHVLHNVNDRYLNVQEVK